MTILSILMPIWNKGDVIKDLLPELLDIIEGYDCEIIVGDNASEDNTQEVCEQYKDKIRYIRNETNIGYDKNSFNLLKEAKGKWSILIGNGYILDKKLFDEYYKKLKNCDYDFIITNTPQRVNLPSRLYTDIKEIINDLGWHVGMMSAIILNKRVLEDTSKYEKYFGLQWIHNAILYEYVMNNPNSKVYFDSTPIILHYSHPKRESQWLSFAFLTMKRWLDMMYLIGGDINTDLRVKPLMDHSKNVNFFTYDFYAYLIKKGDIGIWQCIRYQKYFKYFSLVPYHTVCYMVISHKAKNFLYQKTKDGNIRHVKMLNGLIKFDYKSTYEERKARRALKNNKN